MLELEETINGLRKTYEINPVQDFEHLTKNQQIYLLEAKRAIAHCRQVDIDKTEAGEFKTHF